MSIWNKPLDPNLCSRRVYRGSFSGYQCARKPVEGSEFCKQHTPIDHDAFDGYVYSCFCVNSLPELHRAKVLKRSKKQLVIDAGGHNGSGQAFGYSDRVGLDEFSDNEEIAVALAKKKAEDAVRIAAQQLDVAKKTLAAFRYSIPRKWEEKDG